MTVPRGHALKYRQACWRQHIPADEPRLGDSDEAADRGKKEGPCPFNLAIDSKLRGGNFAAVRFDDVALSGHAMGRTTMR